MPDSPAIRPRSLRRRAIVLLVAFLVITVGIPATGNAITRFTDVPSSSPFAKDINAAVSSGLMAGCGRGKFCPKAPASREQLARVANRLGALTTGRTPVARALTAVTATKASTATTATNAGHATSADTATNAGHATSADTATNAGHATSADTATDAGTLDGIDSTGFVRPTGQIVVSSGNSRWVKFASGDDINVQVNFSSLTRWTKATAGSAFLSTSIDTPSVMYGASLALAGVEFCYAASATAALNYVELNTVHSVTGSLGRNLRFSDPTARTDSGCRVYKLASPVALTASDAVNFFVQVATTGPDQTFDIARTSFIFNATSTPAAPVSAAGATTMRPGGSAHGSGTAPTGAGR